MRDKNAILVLFAVSMVTLGIEVLLTRVFAVVLFSSHSFLAISLTLLGSGAGAIIAYLGKKTPEEKQDLVRTYALVFLALAVVISFFTLLQVEFVPREVTDPDTGQVAKDLTYNKRSTAMMLNPEMFETWKLYAVIPIVFLPFLISGFVQAFIFRHRPTRFATFYGIDLLAANFGAVTIPLLLYPIGLQGTMVTIVLLILAPVVYFLLTSQRSWRLAALAAVPVVALVGLWVFGGLELRHAAGFAEKKILREYWTPMARVALMQQSKTREMYVIDNASRSYYAAKNEKEIRRYLTELYNIPFKMKTGGSAMVIASGGGQELIMADYQGIRDIDAIEIAGPIVRDIVNQKKDEPGNPYLLPSVKYHIADGRSVVKRSTKAYDVIEMLEVNFHTLAGQISQAWSPYFVFTQEAFAEYFERLKDDGYLCYAFFSRGTSPVGGDKSCRFRSVIAGTYLAGISEPEDHVAIFLQPHGYGYRSMVMAKKSAYTDEELAAIMRFADTLQGKITLQYPDLQPLVEKGLITEEELARWMPDRRWVKPVRDMCRKARPHAGLLSNIKKAPSFELATNDDRPFMYGSGFRGADTPQEKMILGLYRDLLIIMLVLGLIFVLMPFIFTKADSGAKVRLDLRLFLILVFTGLGFMFIEMTGIFKYQLYMHHPTIALIVILAGMILGAGLGSLHTERIATDRKESRIPLYALASLAVAFVLLFLIPMYGHRLLLWLPLGALLPLSFLAFAVLGYFLGHVVPLSIATFAAGQERLLAWCWAITVTGSVFGTVLASILSRDYGMFLITLMGVACYVGVVLTVWIGRLFARKRPATTGATPA
jgi:MFS family permease